SEKSSDQHRLPIGKNGSIRRGARVYFGGEAIMLTVQPIESLDLPGLAPYRTMRRAAEHERSGIFVAEGEKVVRRLLHTHLKIISVLLTQEWLEILRASLEKRREEIRAYVAQKKLLETMVGFQLYHGLLAVAEIPKPASL